jgi:hypothetical protein
MKRMAKKMKLMPLFQELKGRAEISNRRPSPNGAGIYLMKLRQQNGGTTLPRRRFVISVNPGASGSLPRPVKINHVSAANGAPSPGARPGSRVTSTPPQVRPGVA